MLKTNLIFILLFFVINGTFSQNYKSIHQEQSEYYSKFNFESEKDWNSFNDISINKISKKHKNELTKEVFGWNPYWMGTSYYDFDYSLLTEVSYFSYEVNANTGFPDNIHYWETTELVDYCHDNNVKISLTATLFSGHQTFLENPTAVSNFIDSIINLIQFRSADGINIDFEAVSSSQRDNFTAFMLQLADELHTAIPNSRLSIAIPAVDWGETFDVAAMNDYVDLFLIMGYEYYWSGSTKAGPGAPKNGGDLWGTYCTTWSINDYLERGVSPEKLCLAVPYYGREWSTESNSIPSNTTSSGTAVTYKNYRNDYFFENTIWDFHSSTPVNIYNTAASGWKQCWQNEEKSLGYKYDYINLMNIAGIGIWALGYDGSYTELWEMLSEKFTPSGNNICEDIFTDTGGPFGQYYNKENWNYTIAPQNPTELKMIFDEFDVELDYDTLFIYDGFEISENNLIGFYTGNEGPQDTLKSQYGAFTFHFFSDNATVREGWRARWTCDEFSEPIVEIIENKIAEINIYPNPFNENITINLENPENQKIEISIFDILGRKVYYKAINNFFKTITIQTNGLNYNSIYILKVRVGNDLFVESIIKN